MVGVRNLFCMICWIINGDKGSEVGESRIVSVVGIGVEKKMFIC